MLSQLFSLLALFLLLFSILLHLPPSQVVEKKKKKDLRLRQNKPHKHLPGVWCNETRIVRGRPLYRHCGLGMSWGHGDGEKKNLPRMLLWRRAGGKEGICNQQKPAGF